MFVALTLVSAAAALAPSPTVAHVRQPVAAPAATVVADSIAPLTDATIMHYIAVKKGLATYWPAHSDLLQTARSTAHTPEIHAGQATLKVGVFDYPNLVKKDTDLANVFTQDSLAPEQFEPTQVAVYQALASIALHDATGAALPASTTVEGKNIALVQAKRDALRAVGVDLKVNRGGGGGMGGGMGGGGGDLNP